jgi:hypothetical protein
VVWDTNSQENLAGWRLAGILLRSDYDGSYGGCAHSRQTGLVLEVFQAAMKCCNDGLGAVAHTESKQDNAHVALHGRLRDS